MLGNFSPGLVQSTISQQPGSSPGSQPFFFLWSSGPKHSLQLDYFLPGVIQYIHRQAIVEQKHLWARQRDLADFVNEGWGFPV